MFASIRHVILDRDGVLNVEPDDGGYVEHWAQWRWVPGALESLALLRQAGARLSVVTNQAGVARGLVAADELAMLHAHMQDDAARAGGAIDAVFVCPHLPGAGCECRKPAPGLLLRAAEAAGIPASATVAVGDDLRDLEAAEAAAIAPVLVRTGKGRRTEAALARPRIAVFDDLRAFARAFAAESVRVPEGNP